MACLLVLAGCGGPGSAADPPRPSFSGVQSSTPPAFVPPPTPDPGVTAPAATRTAEIGSRLTLSRAGGTASVDVNAIEVVDPAGGSASAPNGTRWVAIRIEISNPGGPSYRENPADSSRLIDADGNVYAAWTSDPVRPGFGGNRTVRAGGFVRGYVAFSVPLGAVPQSFRFTPDGRTAPDTGEWRLR